jgi:hypothetical protein
MRFKLTIVLLLANLLVFFVLWRLDHPTTPASANPKLIPDEFVDIDHIVITDNTEKVTTELVEAHGAWRIIQPVNWPANKWAVQNLINQLHLPEQRAVFPVSEMANSGETLASYGLDKPAVEIDLWSGQVEKQVLIGKPTTMNNQIYIQNPADRLIRVVSQELLKSLPTTLQDWRNPSVFSTITYFYVQGLEIRLSPPAGATTPAQTGGVKLVTLVKKGDEWRFDIPEQFAADTDLVNSSVQQLEALTAVHFLTPEEQQDPARLGLASPFMNVTLKGENNDHQTLLLGNPVADAKDPQFYAKLEDSPAVFTVSAVPFSDLANALQTLRESHFLKFDPEKVSTVTVLAEDHEVRVEKLETGANPWQIQIKDASGKPTPLGADSETMREFFQRLLNINAINFAADAPNAADLQKYGLANPSHKITLQMQGDKPITLLIGESSEGTPTRYFAMLDGAPFIYEVSPEVRRIPGFFGDPLDFRDRAMDPLPATANITSLKITRLNDDFTSGPVIFTAVQDAQNSTWADVTRGKPVSVADAILYLADTMKHFRVLAYLQDSFTEHYFDPRYKTPTPWPWRYRLDVGVHIPAAGPTPSQDQTRAYYFTEDKILFGTNLPQPPEMFTVPRALADNLTVLIGSGSPPAAAVEPLKQMTQPIDSRAPSGTAPAAAAPMPTTPTSTAPVTPTPVPTLVPQPAATAP